MRRRRGVLSIVVAVVATGCASVPSGPSVMVLPGTGKAFEQFLVEDAVCRQWAQQELGITPGQAAARSTVGGAAIGTVAGAALGAAIGAAAGNPAAGAAIGAGGGLLMGTAAGASAGEWSSGWTQRRYDIAYQQCMYAKGNQIPGVITASPSPGVAPSPPPPGTHAPVVAPPSPPRPVPETPSPSPPSR